MKSTFLRPTTMLLTTLMLGLSLAGCGGGKTTGTAPETTGAKTNFKGQTLIVTSYGAAWEEFMNKEIIPDFEKETGAKVELAVGLSKDWMAKLRAAGKANPPYDVVIANETYVSGARKEGHFVTLPEAKVPNLKDVAKPLRNKDDNGVLGLFQPLGIAYRTDLVKVPPKSWKDLWKPEYKGKIGIYSANNSAMPMFLMLLGKIYANDPKNMDKAFEQIKALKPFKQTDFSGDMEKLLTRGEVEIGIIDSPAVVRLKKQGVKVEFVVPEEGMFIFEQDMNVTAGSKVKDLAFAFINYQLSEPVQKKWAAAYYVTPSNTKVKIEGDLQKDLPISAQQIDKVHLWDWDWVNDGNKDKMIDRWNKEISG
jgi:putative spermidine/putrescine transport system substrate-binding protein